MDRNKILIALSTIGLGALAYKLLNRNRSTVKVINSLPPTKYFISHQEAILRRNQIAEKDIQYTLLLKLLKGEVYSGIVAIDFQTNVLTEDLQIDFEGSSIDEIVISGVILPKKHNSYSYIWNGFVLKIPKNKIVGGLTSIIIRFSNKYSNSGTGLHSFTDTDELQYLYSHCEPDHMHKVFPCFDQPDIKARFKLTVLSDCDWKVISNEINESINPFETTASLIKDNFCLSLIDNVEFLKGLSDQNCDIHIFKNSSLISTYLFSINAGSYEEIPLKDSTIPMSLYCRKSLINYLVKQSQQIFDITTESMKFYESFFKYPFPFSKYDQIFCPEFNSGAMEHPGAVTVNDDYIYKDEVSLSSITYRAITISHELSHMWFGNLVTMKWWNDLWLNESFAEYFSHLCLSKIKFNFKLGDMDIAFNEGKRGGYRCDQMTTTHPIAGTVNNTEEIANYFDGITYSKGAAVLKQLMFLIGETSFSQALGKYFLKYQWSNATLDDFIQTMNDEYKKKELLLDLLEWKQEWICTAGLNEMEAIWDPKDHSKTQIIINQTNCLPQFKKERHHKMKIAFFNENGEIIHVEEELIQAKTVNRIAYDKNSNYSALLLNYDDHTYTKLILDKPSFKFFKQNLYKIQHNLSRSMIWGSFYDMVRDGKISSLQYIELIEHNIRYEENDSILTDALHFADYGILWTPIAFKKELSHRLFKVVKDLLLSRKKTDQEIIISLISYLIKFARDTNDVISIYEWYNNNNEELKTFKLTIYNEWNIVKQCFRCKDFPIGNKKTLLQSQVSKDQSETGKHNERFCNILICDELEKIKLWESFIDQNNKESLSIIDTLMSAFNDGDLGDGKYHDLYFKEILNVSRNRNQEYGNSFRQILWPNTDDFVYLGRKIEEILEKCDDGDISLVKFIKEEKDMLDRKIKTCEIFMNEIKDYGKI